MTLREDIAMVLEDAYWLGNDAARGRREAESSMLIARGYTDRIMALIAEAMLSEEAVEAVAYCGELFPGWAKDTMTKEHREASIGHARQQVNAALAAAGMTTTD